VSAKTGTSPVGRSRKRRYSYVRDSALTAVSGNAYAGMGRPGVARTPATADDPTRVTTTVLALPDAASDTATTSSSGSVRGVGVITASSASMSGSDTSTASAAANWAPVAEAIVSTGLVTAAPAGSTLANAAWVAAESL